MLGYTDDPTDVGYHWLLDITSAAPPKIVNIWAYRPDHGGELYISDHENFRVDDKLFKNCVWSGPIKEPCWLTLSMKQLTMDVDSRKDTAAGACSNFTERLFSFDGVKCNSLEGVLQGLKFENPETQAFCCTLSGWKAKKFGMSENWQESQTLWWKGLPMLRDSDDYQTFLDKLYHCLYSTNKAAQFALLATGDAKLTHNVGNTDLTKTVLTRDEFCSRLINERSNLRAKQFLEF